MKNFIIIGLSSFIRHWGKRCAIAVILMLTILPYIHPVHAAESLPEVPSPNRPISIVYCDYFPFYFKGGNGELRGIFVDFWKLWSKKSGIPVTFSIYPWKEAIAHVRDGKTDVNAALFHTPERDQYFDFSSPFYEISSYFFHHATVPPPADLHDLSGYRLGAVTKDFNTHYLKKEHQLHPMEFMSHEQLVIEAISGNIDAFIMEPPVAMTYLAKYNGLDTIRRAAQPIYTHQFKAGVKQGNKNLLNIINAGLKQIDPKEVDEIVANWTGAIKPNVTEYFPHLDKNLVIAASIDQMPFHFVNKNGEVTGMLIDLWRLWGEKTGMTLSFKTTTWSDSLNLVRNGLADIHAGCFYSKGRDQYLDYAVPLKGCDTHFFFHQSIFGLKNLEDLVGFKIGALENDYAADFVRDELPGAYIAEYPSNQALFSAVEKGEIRVFVGDTPTALFYLSKKGLLSEYRYHPTHPLFSNTYFGAVKAGNHSLVSIIADGFKKITPKERAAIERRWMGTSDYKTENVLVIACEKAFPPFSMLNSQGKPSGMFIDFWKLWAKKTGRMIEFRAFNRPDAVEAVTVGGADLHAGMRPDKSLTGFAFSQPFYRLSSHLFFHPEKKINKVAEIGKQSIGVVGQSPTHLWLKTQLSASQRRQIKKFGTEEALIIAAANRKIDFFAGPLPVILSLLNRHGRMGEFGYSPQPLFEGEISGAVLKKNREILRLIDAGMNAVSHDEFMEIEANWLTDSSLRYYTPRSKRIFLSSREKLWIREHAVIRLGAPPNYPPFDFVDKEGNSMGIASDYIRILNERLGIRIELVPHPTWSAVLAKSKVGQHRIDLISSAVRTDSMRKHLLFTDSYISFPWVIVTRKDAPLISGLRDLHGKSCAVLKAYAMHERLISEHPQIQLLPATSVTEGLKAVSRGHAKAYVGNLAAASYAIQNPLFSHLKIAASTPYGNEGISFAVRNDWPELVSILNKGLSTISDQEQDRIRQRWFSVRFEHGIDRAYLWKTVLIVSAVAGCIFILFLLWNQQMRKARNAAQAASEGKSEFLASLSHEIRTPMNVVMGMIDITLRTHLGDSQKKNLKTARKAAGHLLELINDILDLSKIEAGKMKITKAPFDLDKLLRGVADTYTPQIKQKGLDFKLNKGDGVPHWISGDPIRLRQILINLIGNALKFTHQGVIEIMVKKYEPDQATLCISVKDSGIGISPDKLEIIFDSFTRVGRTPGHKYGGTGLGLAICKKFAELMGGAITVESELGKGSRFTLILPFDPVARKESEAPQNPQPDAALKRISIPRLEILVAEDSGPNAAVVKNFLTEMGHGATMVTNGKEALFQLSRRHFDMVIMDVEMPEIDGLEATRRIRNGEAGPETDQIPIIALTAHALEEYRQKCQKAGMNDFLTKPVDYETLENLIKRIVPRSDPISHHEMPLEKTREQESDGAQDLPGSQSTFFDKQGALAKLGNNETLLNEICSIFIQETPGILKRLCVAIDENDVETIYFAAHNLKSASDRIGALTCRDIAAKLEQKAKLGEYWAFDPLSKSLFNAFERVTDHIQRQEIRGPKERKGRKQETDQ